MKATLKLNVGTSDEHKVVVILPPPKKGSEILVLSDLPEIDQ